MASHPSFGPSPTGVSGGTEPVRIAVNCPQGVNDSNLQSSGGIFLIAHVDLARCREPIMVERLVRMCTASSGIRQQTYAAAWSDDNFCSWMGFRH
jgi:hypothetical protein